MFQGRHSAQRTIILLRLYTAFNSNFHVVKILRPFLPLKNAIFCKQNLLRSEECYYFAVLLVSWKTVDVFN